MLVVSELQEAITSVTRALERSEARADAAVTRADGLRDAITVLEAKLATAEGERERAGHLVDQVEGLHRLLSDAERAARDAEDGWKAVLQHVDALERAEFERRGRGVLARLRDALRACDCHRYVTGQACFAAAPRRGDDTSSPERLVGMPAACVDYYLCEGCSSHVLLLGINRRPASPFWPRYGQSLLRR